MFGLKRLKLFLKSKSIPLERATRYVGVLDVCLGFTFFAVMLLHINETQSNILKKDQTFGFLLAYLPHWLSVTILTSNVIKLVMGIILYLGAVLPSCAVCQFWILVCGINSIFSFPVNFLHPCEIMIVHKFRKELCKGEKGRRGKSSVMPGSIDEYIPKCENNNELQERFPGFGNSTCLERVLVHSENEKSSINALNQLVHSLQPRLLSPFQTPKSKNKKMSRRSSSLSNQIEMLNNDGVGIVCGDMNMNARDGKSSQLEKQYQACMPYPGFGVYSLTPTAPLMTQYPPFSRIVPIVVVTSVDDKNITVEHHI